MKLTRQATAFRSENLLVSAVVSLGFAGFMVMSLAL